LLRFLAARFRRREQRRQRFPGIHSQTVQQRHAMHAEDGAMRRACLGGFGFAIDVFLRVLKQRYGRIASLRHAVMQQPELADVKVSPAGQCQWFGLPCSRFLRRGLCRAKENSGLDRLSMSSITLCALALSG